MRQIVESESISRCVFRAPSKNPTWYVIETVAVRWSNPDVWQVIVRADYFPQGKSAKQNTQVGPEASSKLDAINLYHAEVDAFLKGRLTKKGIVKPYVQEEVKD